MVKIGRGAPCRIATGQYTGDGTVAQAIIGLGFRPRWVRVYQHTAVENGQDFPDFEKLDQFGGEMCWAEWNSGLGASPMSGCYLDNRLISLDADGFTVDDDDSDSHPNKLGETYDYLALG